MNGTRQTFEVRRWTSLSIASLGLIGLVTVYLVLQDPPDGTVFNNGVAATRLVARYPWALVMLSVVMLIYAASTKLRGDVWIDSRGVYVPTHPLRPFIGWGHLRSVDVRARGSKQRDGWYVFATDRGRVRMGLRYLKDPQGFSRVLVEFAPPHVELGAGLYVHAQRPPRQ